LLNKNVSEQAERFSRKHKRRRSDVFSLWNAANTNFEARWYERKTTEVHIL